MEFGEGEGKVPLDAIVERAKKYQLKPKIIYKMIQEYVEKKYGFKVHTVYIAECGKMEIVIHRNFLKGKEDTVFQKIMM